MTDYISRFTRFLLIFFTDPFLVPAQTISFSLSHGQIFMVYSASHMFAALGGTSSMDMEGSRILNESAYDTLGE